MMLEVNKIYNRLISKIVLKEQNKINSLLKSGISDLNKIKFQI